MLRVFIEPGILSEHSGQQRVQILLVYRGDAAHKGLKSGSGGSFEVQIFFFEIIHHDLTDLSFGIQRVMQFSRSDEDQISGFHLIDRIF